MPLAEERDWFPVFILWFIPQMPTTKPGAQNPIQVLHAWAGTQLREPSLLSIRYAWAGSWNWEPVLETSTPIWNAGVLTVTSILFFYIHFACIITKVFIYATGCTHKHFLYVTLFQSCPFHWTCTVIPGKNMSWFNFKASEEQRTLWGLEFWKSFGRSLVRHQLLAVS